MTTKCSILGVLHWARAVNTCILSSRAVGVLQSDTAEQHTGTRRTYGIQTPGRSRVLTESLISSDLYGLPLSGCRCVPSSAFCQRALWQIWHVKLCSCCQETSHVSWGQALLSPNKPISLLLHSWIDFQSFPLRSHQTSNPHRQFSLCGYWQNAVILWSAAHTLISTHTHTPEGYSCNWPLVIHFLTD